MTKPTHVALTIADAQAVYEYLLNQPIRLAEQVSPLLAAIKAAAENGIVLEPKKDPDPEP